MLNQTILVGKIIGNPVKEVLDNNKMKTRLTLEIKRGFKNPDTMQYDSDFVTVDLSEGITSTAYDHLKAGVTVGVKARICSVTKETDEGIIYVPEILGEKITFISASKQSETW
ncbi:single-stranded DNA-binding protein [Haloplasma contractile]|uniref:Single-strand DNA-binding protein n=1 Tax=Haloplasma contractile SSD-17B TaxID=1033810 RepID=F7PT68_9MOLU|nr:single-stranded DNA-binding protein [Haloplasma contractile]ERJ12516.1 single-strand DNA-binding protein [Haloplasma contractile SSD-17B]